jgi:putative oxidoreductase
LSVYAQFVCGALFAVGLFTRWAGLVMAFNFVVAVVMVHWAQDFRGWWPAIVLVFISLYLATHGPGRYALDAFFERRSA